MTKLTTETIFAVTRETIIAAEFCVLISLDEKGAPNARMMQPFEPAENLEIHFGASADSRKVQEIQNNNTVTLAYTLAGEGAYVTLTGTAEIITDADVKNHYWRDSFADYWPEGAGSPGYAVIKFTPRRVEVMNFTKKIAPDPYGLKPAILIRTGDGWEVAYG